MMLCALVEKDAYKREEIVRTVSECSMTPLEQLSILSDNKLFQTTLNNPIDSGWRSTMTAYTYHHLKTALYIFQGVPELVHLTIYLTRGKMLMW